MKQKLLICNMLAGAAYALFLTPLFFLITVMGWTDDSQVASKPVDILMDVIFRTVIGAAYIFCIGLAVSSAKILGGKYHKSKYLLITSWGIIACYVLVETSDIIKDSLHKVILGEQIVQKTAEPIIRLASLGNMNPAYFYFHLWW